MCLPACLPAASASLLACHSSCPALQVEKKKADAAREAEAAKGEQRAREVCQRQLDRAEMEAMQLGEALPGLRIAVTNTAAQLAAEQREAAREVAAGAALTAELAALVEMVAGEKKLVRC